MPKTTPDIPIQSEPHESCLPDDLPAIVLSLYGASPMLPEFNELAKLGQIDTGNRRTLVMAASPDEALDVAALRNACSLRDTLMGRWDSVALLCWGVEADLARQVAARNDYRLDVLMVPSNLRDRLRKDRADRLKGRVCFISLLRPRVTVRPVTRTQLLHNETEVLAVTLDNYVPCSPEALDLACTTGSDLHALMDWGPLALIEYWAVDPAYDGLVFRPAWKCYRNDSVRQGLMPVAAQAVLMLPRQAGPRRICVRVVDVFCHASEAVVTAAEAVRADASENA